NFIMQEAARLRLVLSDRVVSFRFAASPGLWTAAKGGTQEFPTPEALPRHLGKAGKREVAPKIETELRPTARGRPITPKTECGAPEDLHSTSIRRPSRISFGLRYQYRERLHDSRWKYMRVCWPLPLATDQDRRCAPRLPQKNARLNDN